VIGFLKSAGSRDPGALLTVTILGAFLGIPMLILGWWMRRRGVRNLETVEAGYAEFLGSQPA
jgi:hypothetical protein